MGLVFLLRNVFPDIFFATNKGKKNCYSKKTWAVFFWEGEILHNKKGGYNKPWNFWDPYKKSTRICFWDLDVFCFFVAHGEPAGTCACRSCRWCICIDSSPKRVIEIRGELPGKTRNLAWRNGRFYSKLQIFGLMIYQGGGTHRSIMKKYHFSKKCNMKKCVYCFLK